MIRHRFDPVGVRPLYAILRLPTHAESCSGELASSQSRFRLIFSMYALRKAHMRSTLSQVPQTVRLEVL